jgi:hypothetical protein
MIPAPNPAARPMAVEPVPPVVPGSGACVCVGAPVLGVGALDGTGAQSARPSMVRSASTTQGSRGLGMHWVRRRRVIPARGVVRGIFSVSEEAQWSAPQTPGPLHACRPATGRLVPPGRGRGGTWNLVQHGCKTIPPACHLARNRSRLS